MIVRSIKCTSIKRSACLMARLDSEDGCISVRRLLDTDSPVGFITSAKDVVFLPVSICWMICWFVNRITQKLLNGFIHNFDGGWLSA